ncbi:copper chaperone CopZ [Tumebacillus permanentifrigoris]|uniref:Copper chaperone CopZ n=1 Tax=Tumebacillus permanentifrigoris TaxID=378543 RepID=A0A316DAZ4_9BACL|nr:copper chaperone CopZ [Tumebacillus permanentifrigoris]PWK14479.1 copper chaperone [Tumebacillus permanentifrigoris]
MEQITLKVEGMSCGHCKAAVESALQQAGVNQASVNLETGTVEVHYDPQKLSVGQLRDTIEDAGYDVV